MELTPRSITSKPRESLLPSKPKVPHNLAKFPTWLLSTGLERKTINLWSVVRLSGPRPCRQTHVLKAPYCNRGTVVLTVQAHQVSKEYLYLLAAWRNPECLKNVIRVFFHPLLHPVLIAHQLRLRAS